MSKGICYCHGCGQRLRGHDFSQGRAHTVEHKPFCAACRPLPPVLRVRTPKECYVSRDGK